MALPVTDVPLRTRVYVGVLVVVTVVAFALAFLGFGHSWDRHHFEAAAIIFGMILLAELLDVSFPRSVTTFHVSVSAAFSFAAGLTVGPLLGGMVVAAAYLADGLCVRRQWIKTAVNVAVLSLCTLTSGAVYLTFAEGGVAFLSGDEAGESPLDSYRNAAVVIIAAVIYSLINSGALALIVSPVVGIGPFEMWRANFGGLYFETITLVTVGSLIPILVEAMLLSVVLLIVPLLVGPRLAFKGFQKAQEETRTAMEGLADALERRDPYTSQHSIRVTNFVQSVLDEMPHLPRQTAAAILAAARIHDLGKVGTRDDSLKKPGALTAEERREIEQHASIGAEIVGRLEVYAPGVESVRHHHERWDGTGYPNGLRGEAIPLGARIIAVADAFDAMTSDRVYRRALPDDVALAELRKGSGSHFDPQIVEHFERAVGRRTAALNGQPEDRPAVPERLQNPGARADAGQVSA